MHKEPSTIATDVLVIGSGIGGAFAALKAREAGCEVLMADKGSMGRTGCSIFTAGTIYLPVPGEDDLDDAFHAALEKSQYLADRNRLKQHLQDIFPLVLEMDKYGVPFVKDAKGKFFKGKAGFLKFRSIDIMQAMRKAVMVRGIKLQDKVCVTELLVEDGQVKGAVGFDLDKGNFLVFQARAVVIASGGCRYKGLAPGHRNCTGDGIAMAYRAGALMGGDEAENVSAIFVSSCEIGPGMNTFVRYGGKFYNRKGEDIKEKYSSLLQNKVDMVNLFPYFVVEARLGNSPITMSLNHFSSEQIEDIRYILPLATRTLERAGILQGDKFVKAMECQLTSPKGSLGVMTGLDFMSSIKGLYTCGESLANPLLGGNLAHASTSGAVAGKSAARFIRDVPSPPPGVKKVEDAREFTYAPLLRKEGMEPEQVILALQEALIPYDVLTLKEGGRLKKALAKVQDIRNNQVPIMSAYDPHYLVLAHEANNMALQAEAQLHCAIMREESRYTLREDSPFIDNVDWLKWILIRNDSGKPILFTRDVPQDTFQPERKKYLRPVWQTLEKSGVVKLEKDRILWV